MNNLGTSYRNFKKHRPYSFLNLVGLSLGLAVSFIVLLYINEELGFDTHHENSENVYRLITKESARQELGSVNNPQIARILEDNIPEIESSASYTTAWFSIDDTWNNEGFYYADPTVVDLFSFNFIYGNPKNFEEDPNAIIISETFAKTHFKGTSVVGQTMEIGTEEEKTTFYISAVFEDFPRKSTFRPTLILQNYKSQRYRDEIKPEQLGVR